MGHFSGGQENLNLCLHLGEVILAFNAESRSTLSICLVPSHKQPSEFPSLYNCPWRNIDLRFFKEGGERQNAARREREREKEREREREDLLSDFY